jgi:hypothetical protein
MKYFLLSILFISNFGVISALQRSLVIGHQSSNQQKTFIDRQAFYKAMEENNKELVNVQLKELKADPGDEINAFVGALTMKKAGLGGSAITKLHLFKEGRKMLEAAIKQDPDNVEFHFLRLMIQENAPGFLGYKNNMEMDCEYIRKSYKSLPNDVQHAINDYDKRSKVLKLELS